MALLRRWFFAGLLVWLPVGVTLFVLSTVVGLLGASLVLVPASLQPAWFAYPGIGAVLTLLLVLLTGALTANWLGTRALTLLEALVQRVPLLGPVYGGIKKVTEKVFSGRGNAFQKVVLVEYPVAGSYTLGFVTSPPPAPLRAALGEGDWLAVFVPTTPSPTAGVLLMKRRADLREVALSVPEGMQYLISLGVVAPGTMATRVPPSVLPPVPPAGTP